MATNLKEALAPASAETEAQPEPQAEAKPKRRTPLIPQKRQAKANGVDKPEEKPKKKVRVKAEEKPKRVKARNPGRAKDDFFNDQLIIVNKSPEKGSPLLERFKLIKKDMTVGQLNQLQKDKGLRNTRPAIRKLINGGYIAVKGGGGK